MKIKRILEIVGGITALSAVALATPISFQGVPIISSTGQPVVQIVVGSQAKPSDGVVAANIAAVIGNLAYVSQTSSNSEAVTCVVSTPKGSLSNPKVWLGEKGLSFSSGTYSFSALIGSILNNGNLNYNNLGYTRTATSNPSYAFEEYSSSPIPINSNKPLPYSIFSGIGLNMPSSVIANINGGGVTFTSFRNSTYDNMIEFTNSQIPSLMASSGPNLETENLFLYGFPVFNQAKQNFEILNVGGAYEITFGKPIQIFKNGQINHASFNILGENWTIYNITNIPSNLPTSDKYILAPKSSVLYIAHSISPIKIVSVGQNISVGNISVVLQDLSYVNSQGLSDASVGVYVNGQPINSYNYTFAIPPGGIQEVNINGKHLYIYVYKTFPGLYENQRWAQMQLFDDVKNITSGSAFMGNKNWIAQVLYTTNQTSGTPTSNDIALYGILLYSNQSKLQNLSVGESFNYIDTLPKWKVTFIGDSLGSKTPINTNFDTLTFKSSTQTLTYLNPLGSSTQITNEYSWNGTAFVQTNTLIVNDSQITEPANLFSVSSSIPNAFQITANQPTPSTNVNNVLYNLDTYQLQVVNSVNISSISPATQPNSGMYFTIKSSGTSAPLNGNYITNSNPLNVYISGYEGPSSPVTFTISFNSLPGTATYPQMLTNITNIELGYAFPAPGVEIDAYDVANTLSPTTNSVLLGKLTYSGATIVYKLPGKSYYNDPSVSGSKVSYSGEGYNIPFTLNFNSPTLTPTSRYSYYTYTIPEISTPGTTTPDSFISINITNSSSLTSTPLYWINYTNGKNGLEYTSPQGNGITIGNGFITARGSVVETIEPTSIVYSMAKSIDTLKFAIGNYNSTNQYSTSHIVGPYGIGEATNIPNVTIANVTADFTISKPNCTIVGLNKTTENTNSVVRYPLNTVVNPLVVLDVNANPSMNQIIIGSKFVNSVAKQIFAENPSLNSSFGTDSVIVQAFGNKILVAGYYANQTVQAGNKFIEELLAYASS